jgi:hypothetical protein
MLFRWNVFFFVTMLLFIYILALWWIYTSDLKSPNSQACAFCGFKRTAMLHHSMTLFIFIDIFLLYASKVKIKINFWI